MNISGSDDVTIRSSKFNGASSSVQITGDQVNNMQISLNTFTNPANAIMSTSGNTITIVDNIIGMV